MSLNWARMTVAALQQGGVRELVVCPGSRSAPIVAAACESDLRITPIIDERSAGFFALGQARVTGAASAIVCTSGTAGAHIYPAVIEAAHAHLPLIVITADRPPELVGCGASQTINQRGLFGDFVRAAFDLGCARPDIASERAHLSSVARAVAAAAGPLPGPVHINAPARKPLLAEGTATILSEWTPVVAANQLSPSESSLELARRRLDAAQRPILAVGPLAAYHSGAVAAIRTLAASLGCAVFAECASQLRFDAGSATICLVDQFDGLLRAEGFDRDPPDAIVEIGAPLVSAGYARALAAHPDIWRLVLRAAEATDPARSADAIIVGDLETSALALAATPEVAESSPFATRWVERSVTMRGEIESSFASHPLSGQAATRAICAQLTNGCQLVVGNSLPIRWLEQAIDTSSAEIAVHSQRGVAGIDGLIAGAAGTASASGKPTCLVIGDVSAAHDIGSLALASGVEAPLAICVLDNSGGQIFSELAYATKLSAETLAACFTCEPNVDFSSAARSFGIEATDVDTAKELAAALEASLAGTGATLIRIRIATRSPAVLG